MTFHFRRLLVLAAWLALTQPSFSQSPDLPRHVTPESQLAIDNGLNWLASRQRDNGSFGSISDIGQNVGVTALCGMAFLSSGSVPDRGPYAANVSACTRYLLSCAAANGFIVDTDVKTHGPMYGHGFATMYLAEVNGMSQEVDIRDRLKRAVELIIASQNSEGGWRYYPVPEEADVSVTVCEMMALRGARNAGIAVPKEVIDRAVQYVRKCQNPDGGFRYRMRDAAQSLMPRSAAAVVSLYSAGISDDPGIDAGLDYLLRFRPGSSTTEAEYFFYGQYYAVQAAWQAGGDTWEAWYPAARDDLLRRITWDGHWSDQFVGNEYGTAMALIVLQLPYDYVPIFQR